MDHRGAVNRPAAHPPVPRAEPPVTGVFDLQADAARAMAETLRSRPSSPRPARRRQQVTSSSIRRTRRSILGIPRAAPPGAAVLIQKPMGPDLETAMPSTRAAAMRLTAA
jgi:hypothetical protein